MRKKILMVASVTVIAAIVGWNINGSVNNQEKLSDVALANFEALAYESSSSNSWIRVSDMTFDITFEENYTKTVTTTITTCLMGGKSSCYPGTTTSTSIVYK